VLASLPSAMNFGGVLVDLVTGKLHRVLVLLVPSQIQPDSAHVGHAGRGGRNLRARSGTTDPVPQGLTILT
jgi:hypothetical protein